MSNVIVVGGGAAGMMAAIFAARNGQNVTLLEKNEKLGKKIFITGKGRCNITNASEIEDLFSAVISNPKFLYSGFYSFTNDQVIHFFEELGVATKIERGNRVFPVSDRAADVIDALFFHMKKLNIPVTQARASQICLEEGRVSGVETDCGFFPCRAAVLATGGCSYPATGSTGDGYEMARALGHTVVSPVPSLVPLEAEEDFCGKMQGLALKNVSLRVKNQKGKVVYQEQGELLFTHFGLSGPLVLSASAHMRDFAREQYTCVIDLKPALEEQKLDARLVRELSEQANRDFQNVLGSLVPRLMVPTVIALTGIPGDRKAHDMTKGERRRLLEVLKGLVIHIRGPRSIAEAIITSGGVKVGEIDPKTMGSKKVPGLFFAGELIDVDAYTGGFNLQIAWATGRAAGESAARTCLGQDLGEQGPEYRRTGAENQSNFGAK